MSLSPPVLPRSVIVSRLRAAGCVFAEDEAQLIISTAQTPADLTAMVERRVSGLPLEQVLGWAEFCGLRVAVDAGVFVPRRRTEFLVQQAVALAHRFAGVPEQAGTTDQPATPGGAAIRVVPGVGLADDTTPRAGAVVVDMCCGSGALGAALAAALGQVELYAVDVDPAAVRCARRNIAAVGRVLEGDLYDPLPAELQGRVDVLVANVPYVPTEEIGLLPAEARLHEAPVALDGGADGLDVLRRVAAAAPRWLAPHGCLLIETSERQVSEAVEVFIRSGLSARVASSDELYATVVIGTRADPH